MTEAYIDTETKSECDIKLHGAVRYAEHPSTDIQLFSYAFGNGKIQLWDRESGEPMPNDLKDAFRDKEVIFWAHNMFFDRNIIESVLKIKLPIQRYRCSMAAALSVGLPGALDTLGAVLGIREDAKKIKDGKRLMPKFCKPKKNKITGELTWSTPLTDPEDWLLYREYCKTDVDAMREIIKKLPKWNYPHNSTELQLWYLDQTTNSRGMYIDLDLANKAMEAISEAQIDLAKSTKAMTNGDVDTAGQRDEMLKHIASQYGYYLADMQKASLQRLVDDCDTPEGLRELLIVRLSTCTTSTSKYKKLVAATSFDSRLRGTIQFSGASRTQRDGGRVFQPQNLVRPVLEHDDILDGIDAIKGGYAEAVGYDTMKLTSSVLRYVICAPKDKKLVVADLTGIENRGLAWLAGEEWKLQAFRDFDAGVGADMYKATYAKTFGVEIENVDKSQRFIGKILELACGFSGGVGAIVAMSVTRKVNLDDLAEKVLPTVPEVILAEADSFYDWQNSFDVQAAKKKAKEDPNWETNYEAKRTFSLRKETHMALESLKRMWRAEHPATVALWKNAENAVKNAVEQKNTKYYFGPCYAIRSGNWVRIVLPSGHALCYPGMTIKDGGQLVFKGVDQYTKKWQEIKTHGGKLIENCFTGDTLVVTLKGNKKISEITKNDYVWDGLHWVKTAGSVCSGKKEVGKWLGIRVTNNHKILVKNEWITTQKMDLNTSLCALKSGRSTPSATIFKELDPQSGSWLSTMKEEKVYDLLNCGPNNRFTVVTEYGNIIAHNCTQAFSRDIFKNGQLNAERAGYKVVLPVHDELVCEVDDSSEYTVEGLCSLMTQVPEWAKGLPLAAEGFEDYRYHK